MVMRLYGDGVVEVVLVFVKDNIDKVIFFGVKFFVDDVFLGLVMVFWDFGYFDLFLQGIWNIWLEDMVEVMWLWWEVGYCIYIYFNGDVL